jgi:hypothetical protein
MTQRATHIRSHVVFEAPAIAFNATGQPIGWRDQCRFREYGHSQSRPGFRAKRELPPDDQESRGAAEAGVPC